MCYWWCSDAQRACTWWCEDAVTRDVPQLVSPGRVVGAVVILDQGAAGPAVYEGVAATLARSGNAKVQWRTMELSLLHGGQSRRPFWSQLLWPLWFFFFVLARN
jgi:hypothetical protein